MRICGFSIVRNAVTFDYPLRESISSLLPLCDEVVIAVGTSNDGTLDLLQSLHSKKLRILPTVWDDSIRSGGKILSQQTDIALGALSGDWGIYLQGDEVLHENDAPVIRAALESAALDSEVDGLLFDYLHFYGSYRYVGDSRRWYRREVRAIKLGRGVHSWGDAQGFRIGNRKMRVRRCAATVYHYGWVKPPKVQQLKQRQFNRLWHSDDWVDHHVPDLPEFDYATGGRLRPFEGSHPAVMKDRVAGQQWGFSYDASRVHQSVTEAFLDWIERRTRIRLFEYKNYEIV
jgi:hypothetical protein